MVHFTKSALVAILASTAAADHHFGRRHLHPRGYVQSPPPPAYPTVPEHGESSSTAYSTVPEVSSSASKPHTMPEVSSSASKAYPTAPEASSSMSVPYHTGPKPSGPYPSYPVSHNTTTYGPPGTDTPSSKSEEVIISTATVIPLPETTPVASESGNEGGHGGYPTGGAETTPVASESGKEGGNPGYPTGVETTPVASASSKAGEHGGYPYPTPGAPGAECPAVTITVTVTPTVTASKPAEEAPEHPTTPVASETEVLTHPIYTPKPSSPAEVPSAPVESNVESMPAYTPKPETPVYTQKPETSSPAETTPVADTSSKAAATSSKPKPSSGATGSKRGIIYQETSNLDKLKELGKFGWAWNWNSNNFGADAPWTYVPIINDGTKTGDFKEQAATAIENQGTKYVMGLNEPDQVGGGGSGMSPEEAAQNYIDYVAPFKEQGAKLGSISVTSHINQDGEDQVKGLTYLEAWKKACDAHGADACPVDFVCLHWYGGAGQEAKDQASDFKKYVTETAIPKVEELFGAGTPIWFSEISAEPKINADPEGINAKFIAEIVPFLEEQAQVEKYAYFMASPGYLIDDGGNLTPAGEAYCS